MTPFSNTTQWIGTLSNFTMNVSAQSRNELLSNINDGHLDNYTTITYAMISTPMSSPAPDSPSVPWNVYVIGRTTFGVCLLSIMSVGGLIANGVVMKVFHRQGIMAESSNVSLFALALADFIMQISHVVYVVGEAMHLHVDPEMLWFDPVIITTVGAFRVKITMGHTICWLTAYLSFERCFSVMFPFIVKRVFSPRNSLIAVICIYMGSIISFIPFLTWFTIREEIRYNKTYLVMGTTTILSKTLKDIAILVNPIGLRTVAISIVVISNFLILIKVKLSKKFRKSMTKENSSDSKGAFQKEKKLIKMIATISSLFIICTLPDAVLVLASQTNFAIVDERAKVLWYRINYFFESINSAINIFIYYNMSSNFNREFKQLFGLSKK